MEFLNPNDMDPEDKKQLMKILGGMLQELNQRQTMPRDDDHGWWNCDGCREACHTNNLERVTEEFLCDIHGEYYTLEYLEDMLKYYKEDVDVCIDIMAAISKRTKSVEAGADIPTTKFY